MTSPRSGSAQLRAIARQLKDVANGRELKLEMTRGLRAGAAPLVADVKRAAEEKLPKRGGLNKKVAKERVTVSVRTGAKTAGVRLTTKAPSTAETDQGFVRHPLPGNDRSRWVTQSIPEAAGWWSQTLAHGASSVTPELMSVLGRIAEKVQAAGRAAG